jgi:hypothetical protein
MNPTVGGIRNERDIQKSLCQRAIFISYLWGAVNKETEKRIETTHTPYF